MSSSRQYTTFKEVTPFKVLVIGGSYSGLSATLNLLDLCNGVQARFLSTEKPPWLPKLPLNITIVDERDGYFHLISSPLAFASNAFAPQAWTKFKDVPALRNVRCLQGTVTAVNCRLKTAAISVSGKRGHISEAYDFLIVASGLKREWPVVPQSITRERYLEETESEVKAIKAATHGIVVIGGGAVGIEMAAEIKLVEPGQKVTLIHSRNKLCSSEALPEDFKDRCLAALHDAGVETIMGQRIISISAESRNGGKLYTLELANGTFFTASHVIHAVSKPAPSAAFMPSEALDSEGYIRATPTLNLLPSIPNYQYHFSAGDIVRWSGIKRCGTAMHMGQYVAQNIHQLMLQQVHGHPPKMMELEEIPPMIGIAIGKVAVAYHPSQGTTFGESVLKSLFEHDLGNMICWNYMKLGEEVSPQG